MPSTSAAILAFLLPKSPLTPQESLTLSLVQAFDADGPEDGPEVREAREAHRAAGRDCKFDPQDFPDFDTLAGVQRYWDDFCDWYHLDNVSADEMLAEAQELVADGAILPWAEAMIACFSRAFEAGDAADRAAEEREAEEERRHQRHERLNLQIL